ncbi:hypothetical protein GCM10009613_62210 [Pseudonocardia kongjuensis]|uniref:Uncharacterized protein n=1 Tax=Pseudonocardia kongjuensis TaxID=102227 RepID=A0ABN1YAE9_9PSEU
MLPILGAVAEEQRNDVPAAPRVPENVKVSGLLVAVQGVVGVVVAVVLGLRAFEAGGPRLYYGLAESGIFLLMGGAVVGIGYGLVRGLHGCRTPAIVVQLLLLPVVYSLLGPSRQLLWGIVCGLYVVLTFMLLISEQSKRWALGEDEPGS